MSRGDFLREQRAGGGGKGSWVRRGSRYSVLNNEKEGEAVFGTMTCEGRRNQGQGGALVRRLTETFGSLMHGMTMYHMSIMTQLSRRDDTAIPYEVSYISVDVGLSRREETQRARSCSLRSDLTPTQSQSSLVDMAKLMFYACSTTLIRPCPQTQRDGRIARTPSRKQQSPHPSHQGRACSTILYRALPHRDHGTTS